MPQPLRVITSPPLTLAGRNKTYAIGPNPGIKLQWESFMSDFGKIEGQIGFNVYGAWRMSIITQSWLVVALSCTMSAFTPINS